MDERLIHAVVSHGYMLTLDVEPTLEMEKVLCAVDELTGLIGAVALMRPSKSVRDMEVKSVKKKYKDKKYAAGGSCEVIERGAAMLGWDLDIDGIMEDIKEAHKGRAESAPEKSVAAELKKDLDEVANFKGSRLEQWLLIYCKQNRLPYNRLTEEEKQWLIRIGSKSDFMKSHISKRGKKR